LNSATGTLTIVPGAVMYTNGLKMEVFAGATRAAVEAGNVSPVTPSLVSSLEFPDSGTGNYTRRVSGWLIPPTTDNYTFYISADDDADLFLSTDSNPAHKRLVAQETGWANYRSWASVVTNYDGTTGEITGYGSTIEQRCSDTWTNDAGTAIYSSGIPLTAGQLYYLEAVHRQGGGGDNFAVTYKLFSDPTPTNGTPSVLQASNRNIVLITSPTTNLAWTLHPTNITVFDGSDAAFRAQAKSDTELALRYQWYRNGNPIAGATSTAYRFPALFADNGAQFSVVASTAEGGLSITSSVVKLTVQQSVLERGLAKVEVWEGGSRTAVEAGTAGDPTYTTTSPAFEASVNGETGNLYARKVSGFFIPPTTGAYDFFVTSDDGSDLFLSTDSNPANKRMIAQETEWSSVRKWVTQHNGTDDLNDAEIGMKRSDKWSPDGGQTTPYANGIQLVGGQKYYLEVVQGETGGGDNVSVTYKKHGDVDPQNDTASALTGNVIGFSASRCSWVNFTQQPTNTTVAPMGYAVFTAAGNSDSAVSIGVTGAPVTNVFVLYQWYRNGTAIPGATSSSFTYGPVMTTDNGASFICKIRALGYMDNALNPIWSNSATATLTVAPQAVFEPGFVRSDLWWNKVLSDLGSGLSGEASYSTTIPAFQVDPGVGDNYSRRFSGFFIPSATDDYVFFVNSDDESDLYISTDASPANKRLVAQQQGWSSGALNWLDGGGGSASQKRSDQFVDSTGASPYAQGIRMIAGQKYYIEAVHHEGTGGDYLDATFKTMNNSWELTNGEPSALTGNVIGSYAPKCTYVAFTQQPQNVTVTNLFPATFTAAGISDSKLSLSGNGAATLDRFVMYQWYKNGTAIPGATGSSCTIAEPAPSDNGAQIVCKIRALGYSDSALTPIWSNSQSATLTVVSAAPTVLGAVIYTDNNVDPAVRYVDISFNKRMDPALLSNIANYTITGGLTITQVTVSSSGKTAKLWVSGTPTGAVTVTLNGLADGNGLALAASTKATATQAPLISKDIGIPGVDPVFPSELWVEGPNAYTVVAQGSDIWNRADGFNFCYEVKTGDFDVVVRQKSITPTSTWAKGGLMARVSLDADSRNWNIVNSPTSDVGGANSIECNSRV
ncbi:MAG TPA: hypothetical protein VEC99_02370, partial [Clostridia bacterium]|nr:hypothetical protein [Clostridia bacterium]